MERQVFIYYSGMRGGLGQKYQWAMSHVFWLCRMSLGYVSCHRAVCFRAMFFVLIGLMCSGNVSCVHDRDHVFGQCCLC